jgi:CRP/FNR family cyclic AMP-dependent transcriptional regulator
MGSTSVRREQSPKVDRLWHLRRSGLLDGLTLPDTQAILSICKDRIYLEDEVIFDQGDPADSFFLLNRGCVRVSVRDSHDREKILDLYPNGILGENPLTQKPLFQVRATAHEDSWVSVIPRYQFTALIQERPAIALNYGRILCQRLYEAREDIQAHIFLDAEHRLAKTLLKLADNYGGPMSDQASVVKLRITITHEHLSHLVGANRPHVSTIMGRFKRNGRVSYLGRKLLIDRKKMEDLVPAAGNGTG